MAGWVCTSCTAVYSVGAPRCPQCGATEHVQEGHEDMAKITRYGGLSNAAADSEQDEGGEESSPTPEADGTTSPTSSEKEPTSPETSETAHAKPARTTGSRSKRAPTETSTAPPTDGDQAADTSATGSDTDA